MKSKRSIARGILAITSAAFIMVSLASFDSRDWGVFWDARNLCGPVGALLGGFLRLILGSVFSWFIPLFLLYCAVLSFSQTPFRKYRRQVTCSLVLVWALSSVVSASGASEYSGLIGSKTVDFLELAAGRVGSILILAGIILAMAFVLFFGSLAAFLDKIKGVSLPGTGFARGKRNRAAPRKRAKKRERLETAVDEGAAGEMGRSPVRIAVSEPKHPRSKPKTAARTLTFPAGSSTGAEKAPLPDLSILNEYSSRKLAYSKEALIARSEVIESKLRDYGLDGKVQEVRPGPVVTTFEFVPAPGVKVSQIASRSDDISLALAARAIRIQAPIPGKGAVGIEVPNPQPDIVPLRELMEHYPFDRDGLWFALGKTVTGEPLFADIADMPHLLIAGATGSGKSVCINSIICSLLFNHTPATCRFILVDPKRLELIAYNGLPHLLHPVITEARPTLKVLQWLTVEMDRRYRLLASVGVKNIRGYNRKVEKEKSVLPESGEPQKKLPYYITIIDELADIMVVMGNEIYPPITRLSQMARAVGIHLVFATQRPSVDVVTGLIKANFPCRIAFQVTSKTDSRTILDINGAEKLLGNGDMLYLPKDQPSPVRLQGCFISEEETEKVAYYWRSFVSEEEEIDLSERMAGLIDSEADIDDELFNKAKELVIIHQQGSISLIQRRLRVGYARAARLIDMLEQAGIVGPFEGSKARRVLVKREEYEGH